MKKKLIMILCAVASLSLAACGGTVETDSDSRTEREVEDDDNEDRDKEDKDNKDKSDSGKSLFSKLKKSESIIDEISLYETTLADVEGYLSDKNIIYDYSENQVTTQICNDFLGYDCQYVIHFQDVITLEDRYETKSYILETKEDYLEYALNSSYHWGVILGDYFDEKYPDLGYHTVAENAEDKSRVSYIRIEVGGTNQEKFVESGKKISSYLKEKSDTLDEYEVYWDTEEDITYYPIKEVKEGDLECVEYISFEERHYEGEPEGGYINAAYVMYYNITLKEDWYTQILDEEYTEPETELAEEVTQQMTYQKAYSELLNNYDSTSSSFTPRFCLAYIDEDDVPELFIIEGDSHADGVTMYTYTDDKAVKVGGFSEYGGIDYAPKENLFISTSSGMDMFQSEYYRLNIGNAELICSTTGVNLGMEESTYYIDDTIVSEDEYSAKGTEIVSSVSGLVELTYDLASEITEENINSQLPVENKETVVKEEEKIDVDAEVKKIEDYYARRQSNLDSYEVYEDGSARYYYENDKLVRICVLNDSTTFEFDFLRNESLYYAYIDLGIEEFPAMTLYVDSGNDVIRAVLGDRVIDYDDSDFYEIEFYLLILAEAGDCEDFDEFIDEILDAWDDTYDDYIK